MRLSVEQLSLVSKLLDEALDLDPRSRISWLDSLPEHFPGCRETLRQMLADAHSALQAFTLPKISMADGMGDSHQGPAIGPDTVIDRYRLLKELGRGGMGQVWLAEQTEPVHRAVALKLINAGLYDPSAVQRFLTERQSLAMMNHPAIAKVFDAGATSQGQPYFVMEYVPGTPITEYCDERRLPPHERIALLLQVCDGVQHAHQKAVLHRDLKPANILIVEVDGRAVPRIIDFGLAKSLTPQLSSAPDANTQLGHFIGTPGYISPEQADPTAKDIDTRSDVYGLGVTLYVLLTGLLPFESARKLRLDEWLKQLREEDPPPLSIKVRSERGSADARAAARGADVPELARILRGDLDAICRKALERNPERRYGTPLELAADLRRHLDHEPVSAMPAGNAYRIFKYARRHRVAASVGSVIVSLLAVFALLQALQLRRITEERDRATRITDFMTGMFKVSDPGEARGKSVTAREILDKAAADIETGLAQDGRVQAQMQQVMARTYLNLGLYERAAALAGRAFEQRRRLEGAQDGATLESMTLLGWSLDRKGQQAEAERLMRAALQGEERSLGAADGRTLETMDYLSAILIDEGRYREAESVSRSAVDRATRALGAESPVTLKARGNLALTLVDQSRYAQAERELRGLLELDRRVFGPDHPQSLSQMLSLAFVVAQQGRSAEAERLYREVLSLQQRVLGPEHSYTLLTLDDLAALLINSHRLAEGEAMHRQALEIRRRTLGADHRETLRNQGNLADVLFREGRVAEAEALIRATVAAQGRVLGSDNPETLESQSDLIEVLIGAGRYPEAEALASSTLALQRRILGPLHSDTIETLRGLGRALAYSHRYADAVKLFNEAIPQNDASGQGNPWALWYAFAAVAAAANQPDDAFGYLNKAIERGYADADALSYDNELRSLRPDPRFQQLLSNLRTSAAHHT